MEFQPCLLPRFCPGFDWCAVCHVGFGQWNDELCKKLTAWNGRVCFPMKLLVHWMETADCCKANWPCEWSSLVAKKGTRKQITSLKLSSREELLLSWWLFSLTLHVGSKLQWFFFWFSAAVRSDANVLCCTAVGITVVNYFAWKMQSAKINWLSSKKELKAYMRQCLHFVSVKSGTRGQNQQLKGWKAPAARCTCLRKKQSSAGQVMCVF